MDAQMVRLKAKKTCMKKVNVIIDELLQSAVSLAVPVFQRNDILYRLQ